MNINNSIYNKRLVIPNQIIQIKLSKINQTKLF